MEATSDIEKFLNVLKGMIFIASDALLHKQLHILVLRNRNSIFYKTIKHFFTKTGCKFSKPTRGVTYTSFFLNLFTVHFIRST